MTPIKKREGMKNTHGELINFTIKNSEQIKYLNKDLNERYYIRCNICGYETSKGYYSDFQSRQSEIQGHMFNHIPKTNYDQVKNE